jgi:hypothetical protein
MQNKSGIYRKALLGSPWFTFTILSVFLLLLIVLLLNPANAPSPASAVDAWLRAHWTLFIWIIVAVTIVDFVFTFDRFQTETTKRLDSLEKQVGDLKGDLNRKI